MRSIVLILLLAVMPALADSELRDGDNWIRLTARPCSDPNVLQHITQAARQLDFRAARARINGVDYSACWAPYGPGVGVIYEDGDGGLIPANALKPVPEA